MSGENVEIVRRTVDSWQAGDIETALSLLAPEMTWDISAHPLPDWPNTGAGRGDFARHLASCVGGWREYRSEIRALSAAGDDVVLVLHETVGLRDSEADIDRDLHHCLTVEDGVITRWLVFKTMAQANAAAGITE